MQHLPHFEHLTPERASSVVLLDTLEAALGEGRFETTKGFHPFHDDSSLNVLPDFQDGLLAPWGYGRDDFLRLF